jgi:hypothetical protein
MKNRKLYEKLGALLAHDDIDREHVKKLRKLLKKLKKKQQMMQERLREELPDDERQKLERDIAVLTLQREKGVSVYKRLKQAGDADRNQS